MSFFDYVLKDYKGNIIPPDNTKRHIVINVASECGYTNDNYQDLKSMLETIDDDKVNIYLYPCNDFGEQEPGAIEEIKGFCDSYGVLDYPNVYLMEKVVLKDSPIWHWLEYTNEGSTVYGHDFEVKWNFYKYFIDPDGSMWGLSYSYESLLDEDVIDWINTPIVDKEKRKELLTDIMKMDQESGIYNVDKNSIHNPELYSKIHGTEIEYTYKLKDYTLTGTTEEEK